VGGRIHSLEETSYSLFITKAQVCYNIKLVHMIASFPIETPKQCHTVTSSELSKPPSPLHFNSDNVKNRLSFLKALFDLGHTSQRNVGIVGSLEAL
jgi:hypothetical protein